MNGFIVAAASSGAGKTTVTLGLLRALRDTGHALNPLKAGPDYLDPQMLALAAGTPCANVDAWAMRTGTIHAQLRPDRLNVVEGVMGLFDGAADGSGSTADLARITGLPIVVVMDVARQSQTVAAVLHGLKSWRTDVNIAGVILNRVGSDRHERILRESLADATILGSISRSRELELPSRHLGLVQPEELQSADKRIAEVASAVSSSVDLDALIELEGSANRASQSDVSPVPPLGQVTAVANDVAFRFAYPHLLEGWRAAGAEIRPFSPLADEPVPEEADAVFLPGGYPELYAGQLSSAQRFARSMKVAIASGACVYGECGGFMLLGDGLKDRDGCRHSMLGLLPVETDFSKPRRYLGYRTLRSASGWPFGAERLRGHEFHYSRMTSRGSAAEDPLFELHDAQGERLPDAGLRIGNCGGSYCHIVDIDSVSRA